jgi:hypothetical protein
MWSNYLKIYIYWLLQRSGYVTMEEMGAVFLLDEGNKILPIV